MPYLTGPNSAPRMPNSNSAANSTGSEWNAKPTTASAAANISTNLMRCATQRLVEAVGKFAAEAGQEEVRPDESGGGELRERRRIGFG